MTNREEIAQKFSSLVNASNSDQDTGGNTGINHTKDVVRNNPELLHPAAITLLDNELQRRADKGEMGAYIQIRDARERLAKIQSGK